MSNKRIRIGFIGINPDSHWAVTAHISALKSLESDFEIIGGANFSAKSSQKTAELLSLKHAFVTPADLIASDEVVLVEVTAKVPYHFDHISAALQADKHVYI